MKSILKISVLIMLTLQWACNPADDDIDEPDHTIRLDEYQSNWQKRKLADRPLSDLPGALPGMYVKIESAFLSENNDTVVVYINRHKYSPSALILKSTDLGLTWSQIGSINGYFINTCQTGTDTVYALRSYIGTTEFGKSYNSGQSWIWSSIPGDPYQLSFANAQAGIALSSSGIYHTSNAGNSWTKINSDSIANAIALNDTSFIGFKGYNILKSIDVGHTWSIKHTAGFELESVYLSKNNILYAGGKSGSVYRSFDNGESWNQIFQLGQAYTGVQNAKLHQICMIDSLNGFAVASFDYYVNMGSYFDQTIALILRTADAGENWNINYYTELIQYNDIISVSGPILMVLGKQEEDNIVSGIYLTRTQTMGN